MREQFLPIQPASHKNTHYIIPQRASMTDMREPNPSSRKHFRDIDSFRRERDSIIRILKQANLSDLKSELERVKKSISDLEKDLKGD